MTKAAMDQKSRYEMALREAGLRITRQRRIILDFLLSTDDHPNAFEIFNKINAIDNTISLSTIYRTMKVLEECGAIHRLSFEGGPSRFEQAGGQHHDHLIDIDSNEIIEFRSDLIEKLQEEIARELGYDIIHHRFELYGRKRK
ncbi:transcriptional repressor [Bartonella sp. HY406]|nr:Fur family transcriptional regulator [Bartonella sp. HY406]UXN03353.1 transcriptional repressor [Bartonella sp. HY406]